MSASKLRAAAPSFEFRPQPQAAISSSTTVASTPQAAAAVAAATTPTAAAAEPEGGDWAYQEEGYDDYGWGCYDDEQEQHEQQPVTVEDGVALLRCWYPTFAPTMLQQLLEGCDLQQASRILSDMEFERRRARIAAANRSSSSSSSSRPSLAVSTVASRSQSNFNYSLEQFPSLGNETPAGGGSSSSTAGQAARGNWAAVTSKPPSAASSQPPHAALRKPAAAGAGAAASQRPASGASYEADAAAAAVPWVETGAAVSREYAAARADASDHARVRNACFHQATIAFMAGDKALAKELSAKGKAAAEAMWAAHERASTHIFNTRNARLQQQVAGGRGGGSRGPAAVIDLHGLHVQEMMQALPQQLAALSAQQHETASVIVGVGKHTTGAPSARMGPAVEALLKELGYSFSQPQPGLLRVRLQ